MKDALGNDIIIGKHYGYSNSQNGFNKVHIGEALHETKSGLLSMMIFHSKAGTYDKLETVEIPSKNISVKPCLLFPVDINAVKE